MTRRATQVRRAVSPTPDAGGRDPFSRVRLGLALLVAVLLTSTLGYSLLGLSPVDAAYQTVTTVSTVGFRELGAVTTAWKLFTMVVVLLGATTLLYNVSSLFEIVIEGRLTDHFERRRMEREIARYRDHTIICGCGRVGQTIAHYLSTAGRPFVVIDQDAARFVELRHVHVVGDATDDRVLHAAGLDRAATLIAAADTDAANLYITLSARSLRRDLFIIARARTDSAEPKLLQAGADRVVNPQLIGGARMAALTVQPHVSEFLDVVMHDGHLEFRLEEYRIPATSPLVGSTVRKAHIRDHTGALVLAIRHADGAFVTNPDPDTVIDGDVVLIAIGTGEQLAALGALISGTRPR